MRDADTLILENLYGSILSEKYETTVDILLDPENDDISLWDILEDFEKHGGKILGVGSYGIVLEHPSWKFVLKIFPEDVSYLRYVRFCLKNPRPSFPVFYDIPRKVVPNFKRMANKPFYYMVKTEKLYDITEQEYEDIDFYLYYGATNFQEMPDTEIWKETREKIEGMEKKYPSLKNLKKDFDFLMGSSRKHDMGDYDRNPSNIMKRASGEYVLSDPFWAGETPFQTHDRLVKSEIGSGYGEEPEFLKGGQKKIKRKRIKPKPAREPEPDDVPF